MGIEFTPGYTTQRGDLDIYFQDSNGMPVNVYEITYAIYYVDPNPPNAEILIGDPFRVPVNPSVGEYFASFMVDPSANVGSYRIRWTSTEYAGAATNTAVMNWFVIEPGATVVSYSAQRRNLIDRLRLLLRDHNPDRNYRFRPPEHEGRIDKYNRVFGRIWEDQELNAYLEEALLWWNMQPPLTEFLCSLERLFQYRVAWTQPLMWRAMVHALFALSLNWIHDEFSLAGEEPLRVFWGEDSTSVVTMQRLYYLYSGGGEITPEEEEIKEALRTGTLLVDCVDPGWGTVLRKPVVKVFEHNVPEKTCIEVTLEDDRKVVVTEDHSIMIPYGKGVAPAKASILKEGDLVACVDDGELVHKRVKSATVTISRSSMYDISVPGPENFALENGIVAHNSYSIGGISLDLEKSSKYEGLKNNAEQETEKMAEAKARTTKFMRGLQQPRYGIGIRSSFGPAVSRGVLSPRSFMG